MTHSTPLIRRDTPQWIFMAWASFVASLCSMGWGALSLQTGSLDMAFVALGVSFATFSTMALSKSLRDNQQVAVDAPAWRLAVWVAFGLSVLFTAWGLMRLECPEWQRYYMAAAGLYLLSSTFTLSKTLRDKHDAELVEKSAA
jgi:hypothetical protein